MKIVNAVAVLALAGGALAAPLSDSKRELERRVSTVPQHVCGEVMAHGFTCRTPVMEMIGKLPDAARSATAAGNHEDAQRKWDLYGSLWEVYHQNPDGIWPDI